MDTLSLTPFEISYINNMKDHYHHRFSTMAIPSKVLTCRYDIEWYRNLLARFIHHMTHSTFRRYKRDHHLFNSCHPCLICHKHIQQTWVCYHLYDLTLIELHDTCEPLLLQWLKSFLLTSNGVDINTLYVKYNHFKQTNELVNDVIKVVGYHYIDLVLSPRTS